MPDVLIAFKALPTRYDKCSAAIERWLRDPALDFPRPIYLRNRRYFRESDLKKFESRFADRFGARLEAA